MRGEGMNEKGGGRRMGEDYNPQPKVSAGIKC
jgi:hypothetical protein